MEVRLRLFATLRERLGGGGTRTVPDGATVAELWAAERSRAPGLGALAVRFAVNEEYVDAAFVPADGDEIAIFPPVSGGA